MSLQTAGEGSLRNFFQYLDENGDNMLTLLEFQTLTQMAVNGFSWGTSIVDEIPLAEIDKIEVQIEPVMPGSWGPVVRAPSTARERQVQANRDAPPPPSPEPNEQGFLKRTLNWLEDMTGISSETSSSSTLAASSTRTRALSWLILVAWIFGKATSNIDKHIWLWSDS